MIQVLFVAAFITLLPVLYKIAKKWERHTLTQAKEPWMKGVIK